VIIEHAELSL